MKKILLILLVISLSLSCLLIAAEQHIFDIKHYRRAYFAHDILQVTGKEYFELESITNDIFIYLRGKAGDEILESNFNQREILHMRDVQVLFKYGFILKYIAIILSIGLIIYFVLIGETKLVGKWIYKGLFVNLIFIGILGVMIYFDFTKYFTYFHYIFFTNDLWLLDPQTDLLIQMLPEEFFSSMATSIGLSFLGFVATIQGIGYAATKKGREKNEKGFKLFKKGSQR
ncbi:TIGR01906 family membrane protein [Tissierella carlieri]|uniref:TIGR01906 family membrane protein n=1 Tax=Tissierella carlieri TaxID=689904 RepID=A0ABT1SBG1_9FIRM|nr:TIGR01906 family membrane protein [Tissierella carlieri]MCQ4923829.1 TIGR01906 family membrane protein [Tissierella carlieri]